MAIFTSKELLEKHGVSPESVTSLGIPQQQPQTEGSQSMFGVPSVSGVIKSGTEIAKGFAKGVGSTANLLADMPGPINIAVELASGSLMKKEKGARIPEELLKSQNTEQKVGKALEFALEMFYPVKGSGVITKGTEASGAVLKGLGSKISAIGDDVVEGGVKVKDKMIDLVTRLDDKTKHALERTPKEVFQKYREIGEKAIQGDEFITPYEVVGNKIVDALKQIKARAGSVGEAKSKIMETAKVGYQKVGNIAQKTALEIQKSFSGMKLDPSDSKIVKEFQDTLMSLGDNPRLKDIDATIDLLQDKLYKAGRSNAVEVTDRITGKLRRAIGKLNGQVRELGGEAYARSNEEYGKVADIVRELNARLGKEAGNAGALVKRLFSPSDARTKELFKELEKLTGEDFFRDARIAKFIMESLGDPRAYSMLEQLPRSVTGVVEKVIDYGAKKLQDPIKAAERFIKNQ
jgi:hypothetical protein